MRKLLVKLGRDPWALVTSDSVFVVPTAADGASPWGVCRDMNVNSAHCWAGLGLWARLSESSAW